MLPRLRSLSLLIALGAGLVACANATPVSPSEYATVGSRDDGKLFGNDGLSIGIGGKTGKPAAEEGGALGVNAYLWRGALDTLSFMPLASADPFGGVIITDWFQPPAAPGERFKATAYILGRQLRADGVRVVIFRQVQQGTQWVDSSISPATTGEIENKVLARARELRAQSASN